MKFFVPIMIIFILIKPVFAQGEAPKYKVVDPLYVYSTKFGDLKFVDANDVFSGIADSIYLNDKLLVSTKERTDGYGSSLNLMSGDNSYFTGAEMEPRKKNSVGRQLTKRLVVLEGPDGNCIRHFLILDFSGDEPFVSERFGYNPKGISCWTFRGAKWGKKESYIYLSGPMKYIYHTGKSVFGPID